MRNSKDFCYQINLNQKFYKREPDLGTTLREAEKIVTTNNVVEILMVVNGKATVISKAVVNCGILSWAIP
ncbi:MAG: hypothetical protein ACFFD4_07850 [Candidatus Odinarchaeota archaeon]